MLNNMTNISKEIDRVLCVTDIIPSIFRIRDHLAINCNNVKFVSVFNLPQFDVKSCLYSIGLCFSTRATQYRSSEQNWHVQMNA